VLQRKTRMRLKRGTGAQGSMKFANVNVRRGVGEEGAEGEEVGVGEADSMMIGLEGAVIVDGVAVVEGVLALVLGRVLLHQRLCLSEDGHLHPAVARGRERQSLMDLEPPALDAPETRILVLRHQIVVRKAMRNPVLVLHLPSGDVRAPAHMCHLRHDDAVSVLHPSALRVGSVPRPADDPLLVVAEEIVTIIVGALHREDGPLLAPDRVLYDGHQPDARQEAIVRVVAVHLHADVLRYQDLRGANVAPAVIFRLALVGAGAAIIEGLTKTPGPGLRTTDEVGKWTLISPLHQNQN